MVENKENAQDLWDVFIVFDPSKNGAVSPDELSHCLKNLGEKFTQTEIEEMIREADLDGDGEMNYSEFMRMMSAK